MENALEIHQPHVTSIALFQRISTTGASVPIQRLQEISLQLQLHKYQAKSLLRNREQKLFKRKGRTSLFPKCFPSSFSASHFAY